MKRAVDNLKLIIKVVERLGNPVKSPIGRTYPCNKPLILIVIVCYVVLTRKQTVMLRMLCVIYGIQSDAAEKR